ncbi:protein CyaE [Desulfuromonas versatilis]|uniref:Protein CyaE n=1 Tax=Desulfuromonas versatilis TaxID=2802975 RepID=A0ABM8HQY7_9BACT|nr:TolC family protein [Desulfuromonas versatilis]BCR04306.1 protein CyaE [Desulfuromonas versatilis]
MRSLIVVFLLLAAPALLRAEPLSLDACLELAAANNPSLRTAGHAPGIARDQVARARSGYLPRVNAAAGYTVLKDPQAFLIGEGEVESTDRNFASLGLEVDQMLYDFGRTRTRVEQARALEQAAEFELRESAQEVFLRTVTAYYRILEAEKLEGAAAEEVVQNREHLRVAQALYEQGMVTRNDVLQAEVSLAGSRQRQLSRHNQGENAWRLLNYLIGRGTEERGELQEDVAPEALPAAGDALRAVAERPGLQAQQAVVEQAGLAVESSRSEYWPELFAHGAVDYQENSHLREQTLYSATLGVRINLFDGLATTSALRQALLTRERERARLRDLTEQARLEYESALSDAQVAAERIEVARESIRQGEENLRLNQGRYREQVGTATEVLDAQTLLTTTRTDYHRAVFDYRVAIARVQRAAGEL